MSKNKCTHNDEEGVTEVFLSCLSDYGEYFLCECGVIIDWDADINRKAPFSPMNEHEIETLIKEIVDSEKEKIRKFLD